MGRRNISGKGDRDTLSGNVASAPDSPEFRARMPRIFSPPARMPNGMWRMNAGASGGRMAGFPTPSTVARKHVADAEVRRQGW